MLLLSSPDLPTSNLSPALAAPLVALDNGLTEGELPITQLSDEASTSLYTTGTATIPSFTTTIEVTLPSTVSTLEWVTINDTRYTPSDLNPPPAGKFYFDPVAYQLAVTPTSTSAAIAGNSIKYGALAKAYSGTIPTNLITGGLPELFEEWNITTASAEVSFSRTLEGHPSAELAFWARMADLASVKAAFRNGSVVQIYTNKYFVESTSIAHYPKSSQILCSVALSGQFAPRGDRATLDRPVKAVSLGKNVTFTTLLGAVGVDYRGLGLNFSVIRKGLPLDATVVPREELEARAIVAKGFVYYDSPDRVEVRQFGKTTLHNLSDADVLQEEYAIDYNGQGAEYNGICLDKEYSGALWQPDEEEEPEDEILTLYEGDFDYFVPPDGVTRESFRSPSLAFDAGGPTKTRKKVRTFNGTVSSEEEETWGFQYNSLDVHLVTSVNSKPRIGYGGEQPILLWKQVRFMSTVYRFDGDRYLIGSTGIGYEMRRYKQETDDLEAAQARGKVVTGASGATLVKLNKEIGLYTFFKQPISASNSVTLIPHRKVYKDVPPPALGEPEPKFVARNYSEENSLSSTENPDSTAAKPLPPLVTGKLQTFTKTTTILRTKSPEAYRETQRSQTAEGGGLQDTATNASFSTQAGRPGVQTRYQRYEDTTTGLTTATKFNDRGFTTPPNGFQAIASSETDDGQIRYVLTTPNALTLDADRTTTISFRGVNDCERGREIAETAISMENSKSAATLELKVRRDTKYQVGDRLRFRGDIWWILSINETQSIRQGECYWEDFNLSLGKFMVVPITLSKQPT